MLTDAIRMQYMRGDLRNVRGENPTSVEAKSQYMEELRWKIIRSEPGL